MSRIVEIEERLARAGARLGPFRPTLGESALISFEREHHISLPSDYRTFLAVIGDGGPGPGDGLASLAASAQRSPPPDLARPFPFSYGSYLDDLASDNPTWRTRPHMDLAQPGVLYLATPDPPWASAYLVVTGQDRGMVWMFGFECGWSPEAPTWPEDEAQIDQPPRSFHRWYTDWLDHVLSRPDGHNR